MFDLFGNKIPLGQFLENLRGQHKKLNDAYFSEELKYSVVEVGGYFLEKQIHKDKSGNKFYRIAVYAPDKWKAAEEYRVSKGLPLQRIKHMPQTP